MANRQRQRSFKGFGDSTIRRFPEFDPAVPEATFGTHGLVLYRAEYWLDLVARVHGLPSLLTFCDFRPVPGGLDKWLKQLDEKTPHEVWNKLVKAMDKAHGPWNAWFPVADGLRAVEGLLNVLEREGWKAATDALSEGFPWLLKSRYEPATIEEVVMELRALAACLRVAGEAKAAFRLTQTNPFSVTSPG